MSDANWFKDAFMRQISDTDGWISLKEICEWQCMKKLHATVEQCGSALKDSALVEHCEGKVRRRREIQSRPPRDWQHDKTKLAQLEAGQPRAFSVVSYNVLADGLATSDYYPWTTKHFLSWASHRLPALLQELTRSEGDLLCLQEVASNHLHHLAEPLARLGYECAYQRKTTKRVHDIGNAVFWKMNRFKALKRECIKLDEVTPRRFRRPQVASAVLLQDLQVPSAGLLLVASTHISAQFWSPHVQIAQTLFLTQRLHELKQQWKASGLVLAGDFNGNPKSGIYQVLAKGSIESKHPDIAGYHTFFPDRAHQLGLRSAYRTVSGKEPLYTNYVGARDVQGEEFHETLDYIWYGETGLRPINVLQVPAEAYVAVETALPNESFPSDHVYIQALFVHDHANSQPVRGQSEGKPLKAHPDQAYKRLLEKSQLFATRLCDFPVATNRIRNLSASSKSRAAIVAHAKGTRPIFSPKVWNIVNNFLKIKKASGSKVEREVYSKLQTAQEFILRLFSRRPIYFFGAHEQSLLRNKSTPPEAAWALVGTDQEAEVRLRKYLSYDEMLISALLGVSGPTFFINNGNRNNGAQPAAAGSFQHKGVYAGLVGARFEKKRVMESKLMMITGDHRPERGYGINRTCEDPILKLWAEVYLEGVDFFPSFAEAEADWEAKGDWMDNKGGKYHRRQTHEAIPAKYLNVSVYNKRIRLVLEPFLRDANARAGALGKKAWIHLVGLGLGVWCAVGRAEQTHFFLNALESVLWHVALPHIGVIDLSWFHATQLPLTKTKHDEYYPANNQAKNTMRILFSQSNPAEALPSGYLLVASYAWDSNSLPGNEYWCGMLGASGDPAAACCSTIGELQNVYINEFFVKAILDLKPRVD